MANFVEKIGFSAGLNSSPISIGEPNHHIEWILGSSLTFAALLLDWFEFFLPSAIENGAAAGSRFSSPFGGPRIDPSVSRVGM